jgi:hypothetical protein
MANCDGITIGSIYDCANPIAPGVNNRLLLGNLDDIEAITYDLTTTTIILTLTMKTTKACFAFEGIRQSLNPQYQFIPQTVSVGYDHQVDFLAFDISQVQKDNIEAMGVTKMFAIVENARGLGNGENYFEVYGLVAGLEMQTGGRIPRELETQGALSLSLKTSDNEGKEPKMPQTWFSADYDTTKALVDALLTPAV